MKYIIKYKSTIGNLKVDKLIAKNDTEALKKAINKLIISKEGD